jgi:hypothetical protein
MTAAAPFLRAVIAINAAGGLISALELLRVYRAFQDEGLFSWRVARLRRRRALKMVLYLSRSVLAWPGILALVSSRIATAAACIVCACLGPVPGLLLAAYVAIGCLLLLRTHHAADGSEQFLHITAMACLVATLSPGSLAGEIGLFFLSAQLSLAYATSAIVKMARSEWRNGRFLVEIFATETFGRRSAWKFLAASPQRAKWAARIVIYGELLCSLAPWSPPHVALILLASAALFHIAVGATMGLNMFVFAFAAAFPAAIYTSRILYQG